MNSKFKYMLALCSLSACIVFYIGSICYKRMKEDDMKIKKIKHSFSKNKIQPNNDIESNNIEETNDVEELKDEKENEARQTEIVINNN